MLTYGTERSCRCVISVIRCVMCPLQYGASAASVYACMPLTDV